MTHAMRKTIGPFSAGTRVTVLQENNDGTWTVEVQVPHPNYDRHTTYDYEDMTMDIEPSELVELRNHSDSVPATSRRERRAFLNKLFSGTKPSREDA